LGAGTHLLGRPTPADSDEAGYVSIPDEAVSRAHVRITVALDGTATIEENPEATNPLLVNGENPDRPVTLEPGLELQIGDSVLIVRAIELAFTGGIDQLGQVAFHRTPL